MRHWVIGFVRRSLIALLALIAVFGAVSPFNNTGFFARLNVYNLKAYAEDEPVALLGVKGKKSAKIASGKSSIALEYTPEQVWSVVNNPQLIASEEPKVKQLKVLSRKGSVQTLAYTVSLTPLLPNFSYVLLFTPVTPNERIVFRRLSGSFKSFEGYWQLTPTNGGKNTLLTYALTLDPGLYVPGFIIRQCIQTDIPDLLQNVKKAMKKQYG